MRVNLAGKKQGKHCGICKHICKCKSCQIKPSQLQRSRKFGQESKYLDLENEDEK